MSLFYSLESKVLWIGVSFCTVAYYVFNYSDLLRVNDRHFRRLTFIKFYAVNLIIGYVLIFLANLGPLSPASLKWGVSLSDFGLLFFISGLAWHVLSGDQPKWVIGLCAFKFVIDLFLPTSQEILPFLMMPNLLFAGVVSILGWHMRASRGALLGVGAALFYYLVGSAFYLDHLQIFLLMHFGLGPFLFWAVRRLPNP